jgi:GTP-binding protein YchF
VRDIDVLELELQLADLETVTKRLERTEKSARLQKEKETELIALLHRVQEHLDQGKPVRTMSLTPEEQSMLREFWLLTGKPLMVVVNVAETAAQSPVPKEIVERASVAGGEAIAVSARIENDIAELDPADRATFLRDLGLEEPGLYRVARSAYRLLRLITFFTAGDTEVRAWNLRQGETALDAAASVHTDIARGFIRAEVTGAEELLDAGSYAVLRERGKQRLEGRDYVMRDGDVIHIRFNV